MAKYPTGVPGTKSAVGGASLERVQWEAERAAVAEMVDHELHADPHPQYITDAEMPALPYYLKWGMV